MKHSRRDATHPLVDRLAADLRDDVVDRPVSLSRKLLQRASQIMSQFGSDAHAVAVERSVLASEEFHFPARETASLRNLLPAIREKFVALHPGELELCFVHALTPVPEGVPFA